MYNEGRWLKDRLHVALERETIVGENKGWKVVGNLAGQPELLNCSISDF